MKTVVVKHVVKRVKKLILLGAGDMDASLNDCCITGAPNNAPTRGIFGAC
jgi:hypothetical protein